jgi:hypothetical protein
MISSEHHSYPSELRQSVGSYNKFFPVYNCRLPYLNSQPVSVKAWTGTDGI